MACGRLPRHLSNIHIQNIRAILPILGFPNRRFRRWKSFACSGLDASPVTSSNPIPNLESKSSKIGKFETTQTLLAGFPNSFPVPTDPCFRNLLWHKSTAIRAEGSIRYPLIVILMSVSLTPKD